MVSIMMVAAALLIHMDRNHVGSIRPKSRLKQPCLAIDCKCTLSVMGTARGGEGRGGEERGGAIHNSQSRITAHNSDHGSTNATMNVAMLGSHSQKGTVNEEHDGILRSPQQHNALSCIHKKTCF